MTYDVVGFLNTSLAIFIGIGVALVMFATFFPETAAGAGRRFRRQLSVQLSRLAAARHPPGHAFEFALCEQLATTLARVKDEPALARECLASGVIALSTARAIDGLKTAIGADQLAPGIACRGLESARPHLTGLPPSVPGEPHQNRVGGPLPASPLSRHGARRVRRGANRGVDRCPRRMRGAPLRPGQGPHSIAGDVRCSLKSMY